LGLSLSHQRPLPQRADYDLRGEEKSMRTLIIVESPAKARTLGNLLSKDYTVKASVGHIRDLPPHQMGVDLDNDFQPTYVIVKGKQQSLP
jgi:hypothetical protein